MNRPVTMVALCSLLLACGAETEGKHAVQTAQLRSSDACVNDQCSEGLICMRYGLGNSEEKRCVAPDQVCSLLE